MFIFFGTRASKIKTKRIDGNTECPYCQNKNTFVATAFGKYFHLFWIPLLPFSKETVLECSHCKKTYAEHELPENLRLALVKSNQIDPPKRPLWHGFGCLVLALIGLVVIGISIASAIFWSDKDVKDEIDVRSISLNNDIEKATATPDQAVDSISYYLKPCIDDDIEGIETQDIKYFSKIMDNKLLVLLKVSDLKKVKASSRKELIYAIEDCLHYIVEAENYQTYIGVRGKWNMVLVKTPHGENLEGKFAKSGLLLPFYGPEPIKQDSIKTETK